MTDVLSADSSTLFSALSQDQSAQRSQLAQYSILQASQYMQEGRNDDAITAFKRALGYDSKNATALTYIGNLSLSMNKNGDAIKAFKQLVAAQPTSVDAQMKLGNAYLQDQQYDQSEKIFKKAAQMAPTNALPVYTLGLQYMNTGRLSEAEDMFNKAQRLAPGDANAYYALGALYNKQNRYVDAANSLQTAIALKSNFPAARYELGVAYSKLGLDDAAKDQLSELGNESSSYTSDLSFVLDKPKITSMSAAPGSSLNLSLGANTQLWYFDANFLQPNASKVVSVTIQFSNDMDVNSVTNPANWTIGKAQGGVAGYYNNFMATSQKEVQIASTPLSINYDASSGTATVNFMLNQNSTGDATIDPSHLVFQFSGVDSNGRSMDTSADSIDGFSDNTAF